MSSKKTESKSLTQIALRKLKYHTMAIYGALFLAVFYFCAIFAEFLAPYGLDSGARRKNDHSPSVIHIKDENGKYCLPFVYNTVKYRDEYMKAYYIETPLLSDEDLRDFYSRNYPLQGEELERYIKENKYKKYPIKLFVKGDEYKFWGLFKWDRHLFGIETDDKSKFRPMFYLLGADQFGRDIFSRIMYGGRISLSVGIVGVIITFFIGMIIGGISGYFGGKIDIIIQRIVEMMMMIPGFYLLLALSAAIPATWSSVMVYFAVIIILSFIGWAGLARIIRGMVLSIANRDYVMAAKAMGYSHWRIITKHILPNTFSYAIVAATMSIPGYMLGESALSFLALGIQEPDASWGNMLITAQSITEIKQFPWRLIPGVLIFLSVVAYNFLGDGLRDAFDPTTVIAGKEMEKIIKEKKEKEKEEKERLKTKSNNA